MCIGRSPAPPPPPTPVKIPPPPPTMADPGVVAAKNQEKKKGAMQFGRKATILTGSRGLETEANTSQKTLLGQ